MAWTFDEKSPIYAQIMQHIKMKIVSYEIKSGEQLPTVRNFAEEAGVNPNTMQRAFTELEREGIVFSRRTAGRYVTENQELIAQKRHELAQDEVSNFVTKMLAIGFSQDELVTELNDYLKEHRPDHLSQKQLGTGLDWTGLNPPYSDQPFPRQVTHGSNLGFPSSDPFRHTPSTLPNLKNI